jgi:hypothetical protein
MTVKLMAATPVFADPREGRYPHRRMLQGEEAEPQLAVLAGR